MALLLAMYQKMRLIRERNQATLDLTKFSSKVSRVEKNIERVQKMFTSRKAKLESQAKMMMNQAKSIFQMQSGLYMNAGSAYLNPYQAGGANAFVNQRIQGYLQNGVPLNFKDGKVDPDNQTVHTFSSETQQTLMYLYQSGQLNGLKTKEDDKNNYYYTDTSNTEQPIPVEEVLRFRSIMERSNSDYYMANNMLNQSTANYEQNVSIWLEAATAQLEEEQDAALEPLNYQQTMWELEKEQAEQKLKRIEAELQSYTQLCDKEAQDMAPKFGLR